MDADVSGNLNVQETRILQSSRIEWPLSLAVAAPYTFPIAQLTMNNTGTNLVGYFTLELSNGLLIMSILRVSIFGGLYCVRRRWCDDRSAGIYKGII